MGMQCYIKCIATLEVPDALDDPHSFVWTLHKDLYLGNYVLMTVSHQ